MFADLKCVGLSIGMYLFAFLNAFADLNVFVLNGIVAMSVLADLSAFVIFLVGFTVAFDVLFLLWFSGYVAHVT